MNTHKWGTVSSSPQVFSPINKCYNRGIFLRDRLDKASICLWRGSIQMTGCWWWQWCWFGFVDWSTTQCVPAAYIEITNTRNEEFSRVSSNLHHWHIKISQEATVGITHQQQHLLVLSLHPPRDWVPVEYLNGVFWKEAGPWKDEAAT